MMHAMKPHTDREDQTKRVSKRITVTLPPGDYHEVVRLSKIKRVSASWVVRDSVAKYVADESFAAPSSQPDGTNNQDQP
jgi:hypothetical protein